MVSMPIRLAASRPRSTLGLLASAAMPSAMSAGSASRPIWWAKMPAMPSLAASPVTVATSAVSEMAGSALLPTITGWTNSTATCSASVLSVPVPNTTSLPPWWKRTAMAWQVAATAPAWPARSSTGACLRANSAATSSSVLGRVTALTPRGGSSPAVLRAHVGFDLEVDGVAHLQRAEETGVGLDAIGGLDDGSRRPVTVLPHLADLQAQRPLDPVQREGALERPPVVPGRCEPAGREPRLGVPLGGQHAPRRRGDLTPVPVAHRLDAAVALPDDPRGHVDLGLDGRQRLVVVDGELARPPGHVDDQVVPGPRAQALAKRSEDDPAVFRAQQVMPRGYRHDSTLGQLWGGRPAQPADIDVRTRWHAQESGDDGRSGSGAAGQGHAAGQGNGSSPNSSWIRRRSRIRGSVSPPTHRPTVLTDTPSWRAAASWVRPSRRRVDDIQSAKVSGRAAGAGAGTGDVRDGVAAGAVPTACGMGSVECRTSTSTCSGKMRNETWIAPVGPAASSRARKTVSPTSRLPCSVSGDSARQRRTKSRISGIQDGRAGNVWDRTTTGTTWIWPSPSLRSGT